MSAKKWIKTWFYMILIIPIMGLFYFIIDPLKVMHEPWYFKTHLQSNMRQQAAGIIKNYDFDGIILGTSMLENTSSKESAKKLEGNKFMNLSLSGGDFFERSFILKYALKKKRIKTVLYSLDSIGLVENRLGDPSYNINQWIYLYDDTLLNNLKVYFNTKYLEHIFDLSFIGKEADWDRPNAWYMKKKHSQRYGGLDKWFAAKNNGQIKKAFRSILATVKSIQAGEQLSIDENQLHMKSEKGKQYFEETILKFVSTYKSTNFIFVVPPYSRIAYALQAQYDKESFELYKLNLKYLVSISAKYPNMKIFAWGNESFVDDIANYKDPEHYMYTYNSYMLDQIKEGKGLLTVDNVDSYLDTFSQKALQYDLTSLGRLIDKHINQEK